MSTSTLAWLNGATEEKLSSTASWLGAEPKEAKVAAARAKVSAFLAPEEPRTRAAVARGKAALTRTRRGKAAQQALSDEESTSASDGCGYDSDDTSCSNSPRAAFVLAPEEVEEVFDDKAFFDQIDDSVPDVTFDVGSPEWPVWPSFCPPCQVAQNGPKIMQESKVKEPTGRRAVTCREVATAVRALYKDQIKPSGAILARHIVNDAKVNGRSVPDFDDASLRARVEACPGLAVQQWGEEWVATMIGAETDFVDVHSNVDVYPAEMWSQFWAFMRKEDAAGRMPRDKAGVAKLLFTRRQELPFLKERSLGQVLHIIHLSQVHGQSGAKANAWQNQGWATPAASQWGPPGAWSAWSAAPAGWSAAQAAHAKAWGF